jgi:DnaJ-like protein
MAPTKRPLPDTPVWKNRFEIPSASSDRVYTVAQSKADDHWACSCPGWKIPKNGVRHCKHLKALGLPAVKVETDGTHRSSGTTHAEFMNYKTHDGDIGRPSDWIWAFNTRLGIDTARRVIGNDNPYEILNVPRTASWEQIKRAYVALAQQHNPDVAPAVTSVLPPVARRIQSPAAATAKPAGKPFTLPPAPRKIIGPFRRIQASYEVLEHSEQSGNR